MKLQLVVLELAMEQKMPIVGIYCTHIMEALHLGFQPEITSEQIDALFAFFVQQLSEMSEEDRFEEIVQFNHLLTKKDLRVLEKLFEPQANDSQPLGDQLKSIQTVLTELQVVSFKLLLEEFNLRRLSQMLGHQAEAALQNDKQQRMAAMQTITYDEADPEFTAQLGPSYSLLDKQTSNGVWEQIRTACPQSLLPQLVFAMAVLASQTALAQLPGEDSHLLRLKLESHLTRRFAELGGTDPHKYISQNLDVGVPNNLLGE